MKFKVNLIFVLKFVSAEAYILPLCLSKINYRRKLKMKKELSNKTDVYEFQNSVRLPYSMYSLKKESGTLFVVKTVVDEGSCFSVTGTEIEYKNFKAKVKI